MLPGVAAKGKQELMARFTPSLQHLLAHGSHFRHFLVHETVQEVRRGMSTSVEAHTCLSDSAYRCVFVCMQACLCVYVGVTECSHGLSPESGQTGQKETSKDWMIDAGQSLSLMNGLRYVCNWRQGAT